MCSCSGQAGMRHAALNLERNTAIHVDRWGHTKISKLHQIAVLIATALLVFPVRPTESMWWISWVFEIWMFMGWPLISFAAEVRQKKSNSVFSSSKDSCFSGPTENHCLVVPPETCASICFSIMNVWSFYLESQFNAFKKSILPISWHFLKFDDSHMILQPVC